MTWHSWARARMACLRQGLTGPGMQRMINRPGPTCS